MVKVEYGEGKSYKYEEDLKCVYIIQNSNREIKIGSTKDINTRLYAFRTASTIDYEVIYVSEMITNALEIEQMLHKHYRKSILRGEWFAIDKNDAVEKVKQLVNEFGEIKLKTEEDKLKEKAKFKESMNSFYDMRFARKTIMKSESDEDLEFFVDYEYGWKITESDREVVESEMQAYIDSCIELGDDEEASKYKDILKVIKENRIEDSKTIIQEFAYEMLDSVAYCTKYYDVIVDNFLACIAFLTCIFGIYVGLRR